MLVCRYFLILILAALCGFQLCSSKQHRHKAAAPEHPELLEAIADLATEKKAAGIPLNTPEVIQAAMKIIEEYEKSHGIIIDDTKTIKAIAKLLEDYESVRAANKHAKEGPQVNEEEDDEDDIYQDLYKPGDDFEFQDGFSIETLNALVEENAIDEEQLALREWQGWWWYLEMKREYRKCTRWYRGWFAATCPDRPWIKMVFQRQHNDQWCCAPCRIKRWCSQNNGYCESIDRCAADEYPWKGGCTGRWACCLPPMNPLP